MSAVFGLPVRWTSAWIFNCYIIETAAESLVVVDPGLPVVARSALDVVRTECDRDPTNIISVMCTHGHPDHLGGVATLLGEAPAGVHLPQRCRNYLDGEVPRVFPLAESSLRFMSVYREQKFSTTAFVEFAKLGRKVGIGGPDKFTIDFEPTGFVVDGDPLPAAEGWEVLHTPGHTDDSTSFYHADTATLISGDAVVTQDGVAWFNPEYVDLELAAETEDRLRSLEVRHLLPGHGKPIEATNIWATARSSLDKPTGNGLLARCSRRFGRWT
jgi:glyoxylase-like metal-dependent hydrolase (beta-lactamase superfamily II)